MVPRWQRPNGPAEGLTSRFITGFIVVGIPIQAGGVVPGHLRPGPNLTAPHRGDRLHLRDAGRTWHGG